MHTDESGIDLKPVNRIERPASEIVIADGRNDRRRKAALDDVSREIKRRTSNMGITVDDIPKNLSERQNIGTGPSLYTCFHLHLL